MSIIPRDEYNYCLERSLAAAVIAKVPFIGVDYCNTDKETAIMILKSISRDLKRDLWFFRLDEKEGTFFEKYMANGEHSMRKHGSIENALEDSYEEEIIWKRFCRAVAGNKVLLFDSQEIGGTEIWESGVVDCIEKAAKCGCTIIIIDDMLDVEIEEFSEAVKTRLIKYGVIGKLAPPSAEELEFYLKLFLEKNKWKHPAKQKNIPVELNETDIQKIAHLLAEIKTNKIQARKILSQIIAERLIDNGEKVDNAIIGDLEELVEDTKKRGLC